MNDTLTETKTVISLDVLEKEMFKHPQVDCPLIHRFTDGMYIREIFMPAGALVTTVLHKTRHPFVITKGSCLVWNNGESVRLTAPHFGITDPGTRRLLFIEEDTTWITFHVTDKTDPDEIVKEISDTCPNPMLDEEDLKRSIWKKDRIVEIECPEEKPELMEAV
jgi:hypothetical protein